MANGGSNLHVSRSAERAMRLLDTVITAGQISLRDAARLLDLPSSTALRHLKALELHGYITRDDQGLFSTGPTFVRLALTALSDGPTAQLIAAARPYLDKLAEVTEESAYLAIREADRAVYVATTPSPRAIRHVGWVSRSVPLVGTAVGSSLLADPAGPASTAVETGSAEPDVTAVSAPIVTGNRRVVGAFSIIGPEYRMNGEPLESAGKAVQDAAARFGESLGVDFVGPES